MGLSKPDLVKSVHDAIKANLDFFREQNRLWWEAYLSQPRESRHLPLPISRRIYSLPEKSVVVCVFHDQAWKEGDAAFPKPPAKDIVQGAIWWVLMGVELGEDDLPYVEEFLEDVQAASGQKPKLRGPKKADPATMEREAQLVEDWRMARSAGVYQPEFAKGHGMTLSEFKKLVDRVRNRK